MVLSICLHHMNSLNNVPTPILQLFHSGGSIFALFNFFLFLMKLHIFVKSSLFRVKQWVRHLEDGSVKYIDGIVASLSTSIFFST